MPIFTQQPRTNEAIITNYIMKEFGFFVVISDDRLFINVLRRTLVTELGLPSNSIAIISNPEQIVRVVKEISVRKRNLLLFAQTTLNYKNIDAILTQIVLKLRNTRLVIITTESELHHLALLRERGLAENWITKPIAINQLITKVASIIKPHGQLQKLIETAEDYLASGSFRHVLTICRKIFETNAESPVAYMLMGDAFKGLEQEEEMISAYEHASYSDPMQLDPLFKLVHYFEAKGDKVRVIQYLERLDAISPLNMERKIEIARLQLETGNDCDAKDTFESAIRLQNKRLKDDMSETSTRIGNIYLEKGNPEAEHYFRRALEVYGEQLGKPHMHLFNNLGIALRKLGKWKEATLEYLKAIEISPQDEVLHYNAALAFNDGAETAQALRFASNALRINPDIHKQDPTIAFNLGLIFAKSGQKQDALAFCKQALVLNPDYAEAKTLHAALTKEASS